MWKKLADNIIKSLAKTKIILQKMEKIKGEGRVLLTPVEEVEVNAAVRGLSIGLEATKQSVNDILITVSTKDITWMPTTMNTRVLLNGKALDVVEVKHSGYINNEPICYILRCSYEK